MQDLEHVLKPSPGPPFYGYMLIFTYYRYLRPAPEGIMIECEVEVVHSGKSLSFLRGAMRGQHDGKLISTCEHDKAAIAMKAGFDVPAKL